jgi:hypothetical protein
LIEETSEKSYERVAACVASERRSIVSDNKWNNMTKESQLALKKSIRRNLKFDMIRNYGNRLVILREFGSSDVWDALSKTDKEKYFDDHFTTTIL